jgi:hypothetical protein
MMTHLVSSVALLLLCHANVGESARAAPSREIGEWGTPSNGLAARLASDSSVAPMGACIDFEILFRFEQAKAHPGVHALNACDHSWTARFEFRDLATGRSFERTRYYESGPPSLREPEPLGLIDGRIRPFPVGVCLLREDGEQIPAGMYAVVVAYSNDGGDRRAKVRGVRARSPDSLWTGDVRTGEFRLRVLHAEPQDVEFELPAQIRVWFDKRERRLACRYGARFWRTWTKAHAKVRPGYLVGFATGFCYRFQAQPECSPTSSSSWSFGRLPNRSEFPSAAWHLSPEALADGGHSVEVVVTLFVFETPMQDQHLWIPREGEYTVLAADTLRARWP